MNRMRFRDMRSDQANALAVLRLQRDASIFTASARFLTISKANCMRDFSQNTMGPSAAAP